MNTANLQHAGVLAALGALVEVLREKGIADRAEIDAALGRAEAALLADPRRSEELSHSNGEAMVFPLRFLRIANDSDAPAAAAGRFAETAGKVGRRT